ncbi:hypothetical protein BHE74_00043042 [Ensete ventricosum]|nr:hypothetical protein GW17_00062371 [Ensete ventricosum]RWW50681.1 hypothetical protein BHE74_00043042 [Ensete ventricosum]
MSSSGAIKGSGGKGKGAAVPDVKKKVDGLGKSISVVRQKPVNVVSKLEVRRLQFCRRISTIYGFLLDREGNQHTSVRSAGPILQSKADLRLQNCGEVIRWFHMLWLFVLCQREPLRIFYESLSKQIPSSEMAEFW